MADSALSSTNDLTQCGICKLTIDKPKVLPCLHSFCLKCLHANKRRNTIKCPNCLKDFDIPRNGVEGFTTNFLINTIKSRQDITTKIRNEEELFVCSCCGSNDIRTKAFCKTCGGFICEDCLGTHQRVKVMRNHETTPTADIRSGKVDIQTLMKQDSCMEHHGQALDAYCETCEVHICVGCKVMNHQEHTLSEIKTVTDDQKSEIEQLVASCGKTM